MTDSLPTTNVGGGTQNGKQGLFIVLEGVDGSGKTTQYERLREHLTSGGYDVVDIHFPRYENESSFFVKEYLSGKYGGANDVGPYTGSLFYALDRYHAAKEIRSALSEGKIVLCDRYTGSNMAHQGTKFSHPEERRGYFIWLDNMEFQTLGIPRPDLNFVLYAPFNVIQARLEAKEASSTHIKKDVHEADGQHIRRTIEVYDDICSLFPKDFQRVDCVRGDELLSRDEVHNLIWERVKAMLPAKTADDQEVQYLITTETGLEMTPAGEAFLDGAITNTKGDVYAFTGEKLSPITAAAAMARLSRRGDDMRITILDEFAKNLGKDEKLLQRVITAYGDDSVQQLVGQHLVVENASNLLTKKLEWGRLAAYLEQSTRYIFFDQKDKNGKYKYHVPEYLDDTTKAVFVRDMDRIFDLYSVMVRRLTDYVRANSNVPKNERDVAWKGATRAQACDAIRAVLPVATKATVGIFASGQALESLIMHLLSDELPEAHAVGRQMLLESRKVLSTFLERIDISERGVAAQGYKAFTFQAVKELAITKLKKQLSTDLQAVRLVSHWPHNELDIVPDMLYEHTNLSLSEIEDELEQWPYKNKLKVLETYFGERFNRRHRPGRALEKIHYSFDLLCDYGIFRDLQRHRMVDDLEWQTLTPRYGYEVPQLVEEACLTDDFEACFDISLKLHSLLQSKSYELEAQYATLLGHKMRWKVTMNAREAFHFIELRTSPQGHPGYRKLALQMYEKIKEVHPLIAEGMKFVNQGEDPELTRLAAERYTQFKLKQFED